MIPGRERKRTHTSLHPLCYAVGKLESSAYGSPEVKEDRKGEGEREKKTKRNSRLQKKCPHCQGLFSFVTPSSPANNAGDSMTLAVSSSARIARKGCMQMLHIESRLERGVVVQTSCCFAIGGCKVGHLYGQLAQALSRKRWVIGREEHSSSLAVLPIYKKSD